jgi:hypothetical protein
MKSKYKSTLSHVLLAIPLFWVGWAAAAFLPWVWTGAVVNAFYWGGRELAQSFRPSDPDKLNWSWTSTLNFAIPVLVGVLFALGITIFW